MKRDSTLFRRYSRHVYFDDHEHEYVALCSEFPHLSGFGATPDGARSNLDEALEATIDVHREEGWPLPAPTPPPTVTPLPSGKFVVRLPKTLHAHLVRTAGEEEVSLNSLVIALLSAALAERESEGRREQARMAS